MNIRGVTKDAGLIGLGLSLGLYAAGAFGGRRSAREKADTAERPDRTLHGRSAPHPAAIPPAGWWQIAKRTFHEVGHDRVLAVAAGVTFYGLLAVFPALTAFVSLYGLFAAPATVVDHLATLSTFLPAGAYDLIREQALKLTSRDGQELGTALAVSLALSIWSANAGMKAVFDALNVAYGEDEKRSFVTLNLVSLLVTASVLVFAVIAIVGLVAVPVILEFMYLGAVAQPLIAIGRWPLLVIVLMTGLAVLYRFGPSREKAQWRWISPGALLGATIWIAASVLFSWYVANFEDYDKTYGAVGAVIGLMMWMWISATVVLLGAELNSELERQTDEDTTTGPALPIGLRGADAADRKE